MVFGSAFLALLVAWWASFTPAERIQFESSFGGLANLLLVSVSPGFLEALVRYWIPTLSLFRFGYHEMTPTLEEYHFLLRMSPCLGNVVCILPGENARATFSSLVGIRS